MDNGCIFTFSRPLTISHASIICPCGYHFFLKLKSPSLFRFYEGCTIHLIIPLLLYCILLSSDVVFFRQDKHSGFIHWHNDAHFLS